MCDGIEEEEPSFELTPPPGANVGEPPWTLTAHSKKVIRGWQELCLELPENAARCYEWLRADPTKRISGRCYPLRHKNYQGCWAYEIGSAERIYYKLREEQHDVLIYYAGRHPSKVPYPPSS